MTKTMTYKTQGVCCREITFQVDNNIITNIEFTGGCNGNLSGIAKLVIGMNVDDVIGRLDGVTCGIKDTSCPDQLSKALKEWRN